MSIPISNTKTRPAHLVRSIILVFKGFSIGDEQESGKKDMLKSLDKGLISIRNIYLLFDTQHKTIAITPFALLTVAFNPYMIKGLFYQRLQLVEIHIRNTSDKGRRTCRFMNTFVIVVITSWK